MRSISILSLVQAYTSLNQQQYDEFINYYEIDIKNKEVDDLKNLVKKIHCYFKHGSLFDGYYVGYKIKHISKEFDLLRFGENYIINIELKKNSTAEKITKQLVRNKYYLSHTNKIIHSFCFVSETKQIYKINENNNLESVDINQLTNTLLNQQVDTKTHPDDMFNPSDYLVSPFNSTEKFICNQYFLTNQQEDIKRIILKSIYTNKIFAITGGAGTGKTLLTYDLIKNLPEKIKTLVIHCGHLNMGHFSLKNLGWRIISIRDFDREKLDNYDLIVIDESQRLYESQLSKLLSLSNDSNLKLIFSYDAKQTLKASETNFKFEDSLRSNCNPEIYRLTDKIRTNKDVADFIRMLFDLNKNIKLSSTKDIDFVYLTDIDDVKGYIHSIKDIGWQVLELTTSRYTKEYHKNYSNLACMNAHDVIGQEFDNVAVVIDQYFNYGSDGKLEYRSHTFYDAVKMLFQNTTRTRKKLKLIITGNNQVLNRCLSILK